MFVPVCGGDGAPSSPNWGLVSLQTSGSVWRNSRQRLQDLLYQYRPGNTTVCNLNLQADARSQLALSLFNKEAEEGVISK